MLYSQDSLGSISLKQPQEGYRFSIDSVLLAYFATLKPGAIADLGAGCGVITRLLAGRGAIGPLVAVELNQGAASCCQENLLGLNASVLQHDIRLPHELLRPQSFNMVISNPPFAVPGRGRISPNPDKADARHQLTFTIEDLWQAAARLLNNKGRLALCLPPRLLDTALIGMRNHNLWAKRLRLVYGRVDLAAKIALLEAVKNGGPEMKVEAPLIIYKDKRNNMTDEVKAIYESI